MISSISILDILYSLKLLVNISRFYSKEYNMQVMKEKEHKLNQVEGSEERGLIVRNEQTSLQQMGENPVLAIFGFSLQFPERLARLNDVLGKINLPARALDITLYPGQTPIVYTDLEPYRGYVVNIRASRNDQVGLTIEHSDEHGPVGQGFLLEDIQSFLRSTFPTREARLFVSRNSLKKEIAADEDIDQDLQTLTEEGLKPIMREVVSPDQEVMGRAYESSGEIRLAGQKVPLMTVKFWERWNKDAQDDGDKTVTLHAQRFFYSSTPSNIERVMEEVANLLDKPDLYPYGREDSTSTTH